MKHFITGGSGFFGLHLVSHLLAHGDQVVVFDREPLEESIRNQPGVTYVAGDIRDRAALEAAMHGCDTVHHNAAVLPIARSGREYWEINVDGTRNVLEAALGSGVKKVLNVSTSSVYGVPRSVPITEETPLTPLGDYGKAKFDAEEAVRAFRQAHDLDVSIVRPRTIVGTGRLGIFGILFDWIYRGKRVYVIGTGKNLFQLLSARDLADACRLMTVTSCRNQDFNLGAEEFGTYGGDLEELIAYAKTPARVQPVNARMARTVLGALDALRLSPLVDWHYKTPHKPFYFDITKAKTVLGWQPKDSNVQMYKETYDWYVQNRDRLKAVGTTHRKSVRQGLLSLLRALS